MHNVIAVLFLRGSPSCLTSSEYWLIADINCITRSDAHYYPNGTNELIFSVPLICMYKTQSRHYTVPNGEIAQFFSKNGMIKYVRYYCSFVFWVIHLN